MPILGLPGLYCPLTFYIFSFKLRSPLLVCEEYRAPLLSVSLH